MDKLITALIIIAVVVFFYFLYQQPGGSDNAWEAMVGTGAEAHSIGKYDSYEDCVAAVMAKVDVNVTPYSCSQ